MTVVGAYRREYYYSGLSTDTKPTRSILTGTMFLELDTGKEYEFNGTSWSLYQKLAYNKVWDTATLSWVVMTQPVIKTDTLAVSSATDLTKIGGVAVGAANALYVRPGTGISFPVAEDNKAVVVYISGTMLYVCKADIGTPLASALWQVMRVDTSSGAVIKWAGGNALYDNVATDLSTVAAFSYS